MSSSWQAAEVSVVFPSQRAISDPDARVAWPEVYRCRPGAADTEFTQSGIVCARCSTLLSRGVDIKRADHVATRRSRQAWLKCDRATVCPKAYHIS